MNSLLYALRRSWQLGREDPSKLLKAFRQSGWSAFGTLMGEADRLSAKQKLSKEERLDLRTERRSTQFNSETWRHQGDVSQRNYKTYDDYLEHQHSKLSRIRDKLEDNAGERIEFFRRRFELLSELPGNASVLCLAARLGYEVEAFISLGHFAVGIDLNPGEANRYVVTGDFHALVFADGSIDCVYCNSLDHVFDLDRIMGEVKRVLKPGAHFVAELFPGHEEGFVAGDFEAMHWPNARKFAERMSGVAGFEIVATRDLTSLGLPNGLQCVMRKRSAPSA